MGRFLLLDRDDPEHIFEVPVVPSTQPAKPHDFLEFEQKLRPLEYSQEKWNKFREEDFVVVETTSNYIVPWGMGISTAPAKPPPPEIELPTYGTSLSVTGRKVIGVTYSEKRFLNPQILSGRPQTTSLFDITQQLQLRMQGKVGPKITVNVDYDDTKTNHQDISVVYTGDPDEVVQNVSFGDIDLTLPPTEFVSYNKQLFGIRADIKYKGLKATFIGSRTKGITKSKEFTGNQQFVAEDVSDIGYLRRQYYDLTFGDTSRLPIKTGSEHVYLSQNAVTQANTNTASLNVDDLAVPSSTFTGIFQQLNAGIDYTVDYVHGFIHLTNPMQPQYVLAIDFVDASGNALSVEQSSFSTTAGAPNCVEPALTGFGLPTVPQGHACPIIIKTSGDIPISTATEVGYNREMKTFYTLGQTSIVPDNGRGNFLLQVLDQNRNYVGPSLNPPQVYPQNFNVDFANGIFQLQEPFAEIGDSAVADPNIYAVTPIQQRIIHAEFSYAFKTFILEPNLVAQSEIVLLDNQKLNRNVDYFIDYDAGFITFFNPGRLTAQSVIDISYEVSPFAGITNTSLLGSRVSYDFNKHYSVGATVLYQAGVKSPTTPTVTELAQSNLVYDMDQKITDISLGKKFKIKAAAIEIAQSRTDLNLNPFAIVDNMEGIRVEDDASVLFTAWQIASNPSNIPSNANHLTWSDVNIPILTINPRAQANSNQTQQVLSLNYSNLQSAPVNGTNDGNIPMGGSNGEEVSIVFPFSVTGLDFSQRTILEVVMQGDNSQNLINFHLGGINEDADGTGGLTLSCANGQTINNAPKTEDLQCTGILAPGEDVGWCYGCATPTTITPSCYDVAFGGPCPTLQIGAGNGKIDTEDLNGNGKLDPQDATGSDFGYMGPNATQTTDGVDQTLLYDATNGSTHTVIDFGLNANDWRTFQIPLNITSATISNWTNIKQIRITIKAAPGGATSGGVNFARIAVVGNTWSPGLATDPSTASSPVGNETLVVTPVNNVNNPNYSPIFNGDADSIGVYNDLYGSVGQQQQLTNTSNLSEQALQMSFNNMTICDVNCSGGSAPQPAIVTTKRVFSKAIDISQHRFFNFLLYGNAVAGSPPDPSIGNSGTAKPFHTFFLRVGDDTDFWEVDVPLNFQGWKKIIVTQFDSGHNSVADTWQANFPGTIITSSGLPNLGAVGEILAGVRRSSSTGISDATPTSGTLWLDEIYLSQPLQRVGNAAAVSASFEIPGWATFGGKYRSVDRNFETPTSVISNQDNLSETGFLNYTRISYFPMAFNISRTVTVTPQTSATGQLSNLVNLLQQGQVTTWTGTAQGNFSHGALPRVNLNYTRSYIDYQLLTRTDDKNTYTATLQYGVPGNHHYLPKTLDLNYTWQRYEVDFNSVQAQETQGNYSTVELTQTGGSRLTFVPWTGSSFNPSYSLTRVIEHRNDQTAGPVELQFTYPKSMHETASIASNYRILPWLNPQINYSADVLDSEILNVSTFVVSNSTYVFNVGQIKNVNRTANGSISLPITIGDIFKRSKLFHSLNIVSGYQLQDGDVWYNVESQLNTQGDLWVREPLRPASPAAQLQSQTLRDTINSTQRWSPLSDYAIKGRLAAFKTFSISNNFVESIQRADATGTQSKTISTTIPDLVASISQLEKLWFTEGWMKNTQMNFRYSAHHINNIGETFTTDYTFGADLRSIILKRFDSLISGNIRHSNAEDLQTAANTQVTDHQDATVQTTFDIKKFRFTPKITYTHDQSLLGTGVYTQNDYNVTPSVLVRADLALPRGLLIPGTTRPILFSNRIIWTTTLSFQLESSPVTQLNNFELGSLNTSMDYELAKNLRMTLNGALSREWSKFLPEEDFISYSFGTTLTFQF